MVEVALGMQLRPPLQVGPMELVPLRDRWSNLYPAHDQQVPLPPTVEGERSDLGMRVVMGGMPKLQRQWFVSADGRDLIQLQQDRLIVNWRAMDGAIPYPRYEHVRERVDQASRDLWDFVSSRGEPEFVVEQVEASYINAIEVPDGIGRLDRVYAWWGDALERQHHLGHPTDATLGMVFDVPDLGTPPVRMYVNVQPADAQEGRRVLFMTLTVRGAPADTSREGALVFMDGARGHIVNTFTEMTTDAMHQVWGRRA